ALLVKSALEELRTLGAAEAESLRQLELERLDAMLMGIWSAASRGDLASIDRAIKIMERRSRFLGLDAPEKVAPTTPDGDTPYEPFEASVERIALLLGVPLDRARAMITASESPTADATHAER